MDSTEAPVSTAVELATLAMRAFRYFAGTLRCGFVSMRALLAITLASLETLYIMAWIEAIGK